MFALSLTIYEIFANKINSTSLLENESLGQGEKQNLFHSTGNVRFYIAEFFSQFDLPGNKYMFTQVDTHTNNYTYTYTHTYADTHIEKQGFQL